MESKSAPLVEVKTNSTPGEFEAIFSVIGNVDRQGDMVMPDAFKTAMENDLVPPCYWAHKHEIPPIGDGYDWSVKGNDVHYKAQLFVGPDDNHQYAQMVYAGMKSRDGRPPAIRQFSYTYGIPEGGAERVMLEGKAVRQLHEIRPVAEVGPCFIGANASTDLVTAAKSASVDVAKLVLSRKRVGREMSMKDLLAETLGVKDYGDIEGYAIRMLLDMLDDSVSFIQWSENDAAITQMQGVAGTLLEMVTGGFAQVSDLMARGDAIEAIVNGDEPNVEVIISIEKEAEIEAAKLAKKSGEPVAEETPAEEKPAAEETPAEEPAPAVEEPGEEPDPDKDAAEKSEIEAAPTDEDADTSDAEKSVTSDPLLTVMDDELARLLTAKPTH